MAGSDPMQGLAFTALFDDPSRLNMTLNQEKTETIERNYVGITADDHRNKTRDQD